MTHVPFNAILSVPDCAKWILSFVAQRVRNARNRKIERPVSTPSVNTVPSVRYFFRLRFFAADVTCGRNGSPGKDLRPSEPRPQRFASGCGWAPHMEATEDVQSILLIVEI
jgi:hypothetical protein